MDRDDEARDFGVNRYYGRSTMGEPMSDYELDVLLLELRLARRGDSGGPQETMKR